MHEPWHAVGDDFMVIYRPGPTSASAYVKERRDGRWVTVDAVRWVSYHRAWMFAIKETDARAS